MYGYPPDLVGTLFLGLPDSSRTKMHISGQKLTVEQSLMAMMCDALNILVWQNTKDAQKGRNKPKSIFQLLNGNEKEKDFMTFATPEEFEKAFNS